MKSPEYGVLPQHHNTTKPVLDDFKIDLKLYRQQNYSLLMATSAPAPLSYILHVHQFVIFCFFFHLRSMKQIYAARKKNRERN